MRHVTCDGTTKILLKVRKSRMRAGKTTNTCLFTVREVFPQQNPTWFEAIGQSWAKNPMAVAQTSGVLTTVEGDRKSVV